ncbi:MAG: aminotransferase class I/II-fold pyridoxal phosphate-dependent enzyme [Verrucomicrobia bacterium]|nr:aminotransferase class I/II-fold pyridoxal phosphate-dependent enzyme [Verrucomicrobiota bacterium]
MNPLPLFKLEDYLSQWEFKAPHLLCCSDAQTVSMKELLLMADPEGKNLWDNLHLNYTEVKGLPALRDEIASLYSELKADDIQMFAGAEEGIYCTMRAMLSPEDHVIALVPAYQSLVDLPRAIGAEVTTIALKAEHNWKLDMDLFAKAFRPNTKLVVINFPHNPTGTILDKSSLKTMIDLCRKSGAYLFSDEVYRLMELDEKDRLPSIADLYEKGLSLSVMSKAFGMAGLRIGWIACRDRKMLAKIAEYKHYASICNSAPSEILALIALRAKDKILSRVHQIMRSNIQMLDAFFATHADLLRWVRPLGGCIGFPELLAKEPVDRFCQRLVEKKGVLLMPATIYDTPGNFFRIGFGRANMPQALDKLSEFIKEEYR